MKARKLPRAFYLRPTLSVARDLLGKILVRRCEGRRLSGRIVEVEAYLGEKDPASHAYRGRTPRNDVMFWDGGHLYVYFTYGMHFCCNVVTEAEGKARAVLIRAIEPVEGIGTMAANRGLNLRSADDLRNLTSGPAKVCQAMGIGRAENGTDLTGTQIYFLPGELPARSKIATSTRIGIKAGIEMPCRFSVAGNPFVSKRPATRA